MYNKIFKPTNNTFTESFTIPSAKRKPAQLIPIPHPAHPRINSSIFPNKSSKTSHQGNMNTSAAFHKNFASPQSEHPRAHSPRDIYPRARANNNKTIAHPATSETPRKIPAKIYECARRASFTPAPRAPGVSRARLTSPGGRIPRRPRAVNIARRDEPRAADAR